MLPSPKHFEQASSWSPGRRPPRASSRAGPRGAPEQLQEYADAGYDEIYVANMGPHYLAMIEFYGSEILPAIKRSPCD